MELDVVGLSRLQFAATALYHFLFVPLTLGLSILLAIMETVYVFTKRPIWRQMTKFWGILFGINFALGVSTGIVMEFQFGMNWSYYSHYVGDIFGAPLAIEGLMAFFLEATLVGLFFFGWERLSKVKHLIVTWGMAIGTNLSALWILVANGWMQNPSGSAFNPITMRMEVTSFYDVLFNSVAQAKFVHTVSAGYVTGAVFVVGVSAWYILKGRHLDLAKRSISVASAFGLAASLSVVVLGDESGYLSGEHQSMKMAAIEGMWETEAAPAGFTLVGLPSQKDRETHYAVKIPAVMGLIGTRSLTKEIPGIDKLVEQAKERIQNGMIAYDLMEDIRSRAMQRQPIPTELKEGFAARSRDLGHALLLKAYVEDPRQATVEDIANAAWSTVPQIAPLFWTFRIMVAVGFALILFNAVVFWYSAKNKVATKPWLLRLCVWFIPLPWIAIECGWFVAEFGRQPWAIEGVLPVAIAVSNLSAASVLGTLLGFVAIYSTLLVIEIRLMLKAIRKGPELDQQDREELKASSYALPQRQQTAS